MVEEIHHVRRELLPNTIKKIKGEFLPKVKLKTTGNMNLDQKVFNYILNHPDGVKIQDMEEPLGEMRMKLGFIANKLFEEGKIRKIEQMFFPIESSWRYDVSQNRQ
jgi:hypothetical protein